MDQLLLERWQTGQPPFGGWTVGPGDADIRPEEMAPIVAGIISFLRTRLGIEESVVCNEDWHEHDGFVTESRECAFEVLAKEIADRSSRWAGPADDLVLWAIYDRNLQFLLRFRTEDSPDGSYFDVTAPKEVVVELSKRILEEFGKDSTLSPAKEYFDRRYGG